MKISGLYTRTLPEQIKELYEMLCFTSNLPMEDAYYSADDIAEFGFTQGVIDNIKAGITGRMRYVLGDGYSDIYVITVAQFSPTSEHIVLLHQDYMMDSAEQFTIHRNKSLSWSNWRVEYSER